MRGSRPPVEALLAGALLAVALLGPASPRLSEGFLGVAAVDHYGTQWFYAFVERQLAAGRGLGHSDLLFFPWGKDVYLHTGANLLDALACLPFRRLLGPVLGYNAFLLAGLALGAWAFYALARRFVEDRGVAALAGLLFAASPYALYEAVEGRPTQAILALLPLVLLQAWRCGVEPGLRAPLLGGALLALLGYQYWYYGFFAACSVLGLALWRAVRPPPDAGSRARSLLRFGLLFGLAAALVAPAALPILLRTEAGGVVPGLLEVSSWGLRGVDPVTAEGHPVALLCWQPLLDQVGFLMPGGAGGQRFVGHQRAGLLAWVLILALYLRRPGALERGGFLALGAPALLLALGPVLAFGSAYLPNPAYVGLARGLGFLRRLWWPARAFAVLDVLLLLALAQVLARWLPRARVWRWVALLGLLGAWLLGLHRAGLAPLPLWDARIPPGYRCLAEGDPGAIIELPFGISQAHLYYQGAHGRPMLGGMLERNPVFSPPEAVAFRERNRFVAALLALSGGAGPAPDHIPVADVEEAWSLGFRWVVLQRDALASASSEGEKDLLVERGQRSRRRRVEQDLVAVLGEPVWADESTWIWPLPGLSGSRRSPCAGGPDLATPEASDMIQIIGRPASASGSVLPMGVRMLHPLGRNPVGPGRTEAR